MIERRKRIEVYNCGGSNVIGSSVEVLLRVSPGGGKIWEESTTIGISPGGTPMASMGNYNDVSSRV